MRRKFAPCATALLLALAQAPTATAAMSAQEQFNRDVGRVHASGLGVLAMAAECTRLLPSSGPAIKEAVEQWRSRNARALQASTRHWNAVLERETKVPGPSPGGYQAAIDAETARRTEKAFAVLGGRESDRSLEFCENYPSRLKPLSLEAQYPRQLEAMRHCHEAGTCANLKNGNTD